LSELREPGINIMARIGSLAVGFTSGGSSAGLDLCPESQFLSSLRCNPVLGALVSYEPGDLTLLGSALALVAAGGALGSCGSSVDEGGGPSSPYDWWSGFFVFSSEVAGGSVEFDGWSFDGGSIGGQYLWDGTEGWSSSDT